MSDYNNKSCVIAGYAIDCADSLPYSLTNIIQMTPLFEKFDVIIAYDESTDNTFELINKFKGNRDDVHLILNTNRLSPLKNINNANAKNSIMQLINMKFKDYDYFILLDLDSYGKSQLNISLLNQFIKRDKDWDIISFNRNNNNDMWALRYNPYFMNPFAWGENYKDVIEHTKKDIQNKLSKLTVDQYLEVASSFNGIAIHKMKYILDCKFDGKHDAELLKKFDIVYNCYIFVKKEFKFQTNYYHESEYVNFYYEAKFKNPIIYLY